MSAGTKSGEASGADAGSTQASLATVDRARPESVLWSIARSELKHAWIEQLPSSVEVWALTRTGVEARLTTVKTSSPAEELVRLRELLLAQDFQPDVRVALGPSNDPAQWPSWFRTARWMVAGLDSPEGSEFIPVPMSGELMFRIWLAFLPLGALILLSPLSPELKMSALILLLGVWAVLSRSPRLLGQLSRAANDGTYLLDEGILIIEGGLIRRFVPVEDVLEVETEMDEPASFRFLTAEGVVKHVLSRRVSWFEGSDNDGGPSPKQVHEQLQRWDERRRRLNATSLPSH